MTAANVGSLWEQTRAWLAAFPPLQACELDLSAVRFMDSSGLGLMIRAKKLADAQQKRLRFTHAGPAVRNVIRLAKLDGYLLASPKQKSSRSQDLVPLNSQTYG